MKYSQYPYERIDLDKFKKNIESMIDDFKSAESADKQIKIIKRRCSSTHLISLFLFH